MPRPGGKCDQPEGIRALSVSAKDLDSSLDFFAALFSFNVIVGFFLASLLLWRPLAMDFAPAE
jgi:hypothetical protein